MNEKPETLKTEVQSEVIQNLVYVIRGKQVMLDSDLACLYHVETKRLNEAVKRNITRFPERFRFQLTKEEYDNLKSQIATSNIENGYGGRRKLPYAFTEQGIAMLSSVLRSDIAIQVNIRIMDTFVEMRKYMSHTSLILEKVNQMEIRQFTDQQKNEQRFEQVFNYIANHQKNNQKLFFDGQIFDAFYLLTEIIKQAKEEIVLLDGYVDVGTLNILAKKRKDVKVCIYTFPNTKLTVQDTAKFNMQYPALEVKYTKAFHDRFLMLDRCIAYHIGASVKDAGKKCFGIMQIEDTGVINDVLARAELTSRAKFS
ncbi:MAG: ORF6N domain-containing protein [Lachnospiraceae bacterium]|nr:ORF6N domain-containing protein [Lachnospiraceae bacterium]